MTLGSDRTDAPVDGTDDDTAAPAPAAVPASGPAPARRGQRLLLAATAGVAGALLLALRHIADPAYGVLLLLACATGVGMLAALTLAWRAGRLNPASPPTLFALVFFLPSFVVGSVLVAVGWARPAYLVHAGQPARSLALAQLYAAVALAALWVGFRWAPVAPMRAGWRWLRVRWTATARLPAVLRGGVGGARRKPSDVAVLFDACVLLGLALVASIVSFLHDPSGHQSGAAEGTVAMLRYAGGLSVPGAFLVWLLRSRVAAVPRRYARLALALMVAVVVVQAVITGSRGSALTIAIALGLASWMAGTRARGAAERRPRITRRTAAMAVAVGLVLFMGVLFGSTYRAERQAAGAFAPPATQFDAPGAALAGQQFRGLDPQLQVSLPAAAGPFAGTPAAAGPGDDVPLSPTAADSAGATAASGVIDEQLDLTGRTWSAIVDRGLGGNISFVADRLVERLDQVASFGLVVDQHDELQGQEDELGLDTGIVQSVAVAVVPRALWPGKPVVGDIRTLSGLYFRDDGNSYAITAMGDLVRQHGPLGVPVGMALLGMLLRLLHVLLARPGRSPYRMALFVALMLRATNLEGFYSVIFADMVRVAAVVLVAFAAARGIRWVADAGRTHLRANNAAGV